MVLQCLTWIPHLCGHLFGLLIVHIKGDVELLPNDVIIEILSRLPADCVLQCRMVCKLWQRLTSTPYFAELHLKRATPSLFVHCILLDSNLEFFSFNEEGKQNKLFTKIRLSSPNIMEKHLPKLINSCNGLLLFNMHLIFMSIIYNPITGEQITQRTPFKAGCFYGIYFHPLTREYKLLYACSQENCYQYFVCTLGLKTFRQLTSLPFRPAVEVTVPAIVNGSLHWMVMYEYRNKIGIRPCRNAIIVFNTDSENLYVMPHPGNECRYYSQSHQSMHLLEMKEHLALCHLLGKLIDVWVLEDYANWGWVRRYKVNLDWDVKRYPFGYSHDNDKVTILRIQNGELLLSWFWRGLFWYHLGLNTVRKVERQAMEMLGSHYSCCSSVPYTKSLVTLNHI